MDGLIKSAAGAVGAWRKIKAQKWRFVVLSLLVFSSSTLVLARLDLLPEAPSGSGENKAESLVITHEEVTAPMLGPVELPTRVTIPTIGVDTTIANPETTNVAALDELLLEGAVRYPTSAKLGEEGNVVLFGHSSYLPVVGNRAYKAFNEIQKLKEGDLITVYASNTAYIYAVRMVEKETAEEGVIPLQVAGRVLTLATCDSFGTKSDRFVVTADLVESYPVGA